MDYAKIQEIPVELLLEHPENSNFMNAETARKLRHHIGRTGRYEPLTVRPHPNEDEKYQVINGHNRLRVLRALDYRTVNCVVWKLDDDLEDIEGIYLDLSKSKNILMILSDSKKVRQKLETLRTWP